MTREARRRLRRLTNSTPSNFHELRALSRNIISNWINCGYDYDSEHIKEFISIDSQADDACLQGDDKEQDKFFDVFRDICIQELQNLKGFLE